MITATESRRTRRVRDQIKAFYDGFKGANDENLRDWVFSPIEINTILKNDLQKLRTRSRNLARNDDTAVRYLSIKKQNVIGHTGIGLQAKNKLADGTLDKDWNQSIESEWKLWGRKRRKRGVSMAPSACGQMSWLQLQWLINRTRAIDGECFVQILKGYPHNEHRFALRLLNADLLDAGYGGNNEANGNRVEMGVEIDEFERPVAYHFQKDLSANGKDATIRIPADQIIHIFRNEYPGQRRGIPDFAPIMHKLKMLNGVHEAIVVGWRVAACKVGFIVSKDDSEFDVDPGEDPDFEEADSTPESVFDATPGSFTKLDSSTDIKTFDAKYPDSTYAEGHKTFMRQLSNGLNTSSPTLSNDYSDVNYSSLRQALLEDRTGFRCDQYEFIDDVTRPVFDEWYAWSRDVTQRIQVPLNQLEADPEIVPQPRGWTWVDPLKEVRAQVEANAANLRTRQSIISDNDGGDFEDTVEQLQAEAEELARRNLLAAMESDSVEEPEPEPEEE